MAEQDNVRVVQDAYAAFQRGDIPGLLEILSEDIDWWTPGTPGQIPYAGRLRGRDDVRGFFDRLSATEEITHFEPGEFIAQGDKVVVTGNYKGRTRAAGRDYDLDWLHLFTVRDGRISAFREYVDTAALAEAHRGAAAQTA
ncbi:MAG TPA: nuclear transport factor 2 family protein [Pyrinomonadaceae bacterium]|nr:nuclear transport factor 2 family protein [Pyrinomonadaceae bacterium]